MIGKQTMGILVAGLVSVAMCSSDQVVAQCSGGGGRGGGMPTGSATQLNTSLPYSSNVLASNYPQSLGLMAQQYSAQVQNQIYAMGYQNAQRQRAARIAYEERVRPMRLARAEAKRAARAERIARLVEKRENETGGDTADRYSLVSLVTN
ncbi:hypothetical protein [Planctomycetes bacterium TBK1r]|uniref:Lipoprotein n=1 Tax=Stieleria magnilauensis TaxID=2527963 RepID=A0ABX5XJB0_9BACT|nr:hypothetical protein TBK1r_09780 [Planctomycetes bacterium TBK1r]